MEQAFRKSKRLNDSLYLGCLARERICVPVLLHKDHSHLGAYYITADRFQEPRKEHSCDPERSQYTNLVRAWLPCKSNQFTSRRTTR